jgi:hypothetical protein
VLDAHHALPVLPGVGERLGGSVTALLNAVERNEGGAKSRLDLGDECLEARRHPQRDRLFW